METTLFVYGTLKTGEWNHSAYLSNAISVRPALLQGQIYTSEYSGIPFLKVADKSIHGRAIGRVG